MNEIPPTLRVLDAERHVDTEPVAEYWRPKRDDFEPEWVSTYRRLTAYTLQGCATLVAAAGMGTAVGNPPADASIEAALTAGDMATGLPVAVAGMLLFSLVESMHPRTENVAGFLRMGLLLAGMMILSVAGVSL